MLVGLRVAFGGCLIEARDEMDCPMIRVIINADDFGLSPTVNRGIVAAFREGVLSSTTMMVNMPGFGDAVRLAKEHPDLPVGIHLSLIWGAPVAPAETVSSLVNGSGDFAASTTALALRYATGRLADEDMKREFGAQVDRFRETGLTPTHVDTHKHIHCLPRILDAIIAVASEKGIGKIRLPVEGRVAPASGHGKSLTASAKRAVLRTLFRGARQKLTAVGMKTTDHFAGLRETGRLDAESLDRILSDLQSGVTEIMCHPGEAEDVPSTYGRSLDRAMELDALRDTVVKKRIAASGIQLTNFADI